MLKTLKKSVHIIIAILCSATLFLAGAFIAPEPVKVSADGPDDSFTAVSFGNLNIENGTYGYNDGDYAVNEVFDDTFLGKYFVGNVNFASAGVTLYVAGTTAGKGLSFELSSAGLIMVKFDGASVVNLNTTRLTQSSISTFKNTTISLGVTFEKEAANSLKLAFYINGELYRNRTYSVSTNVDNTLGKTVSIKSNSNGMNITVSSDSGANLLPDTSLEWITTSHFYLEDGVYGYNGGNAAVKGSYPLASVKNTYFTADVKFSAKEGASIRYAGAETDGGTTGFMLALEEGKLCLRDALGGSDFSKEFTADKAGLTAFADTKFKLGISIKTVDADLDGSHDDVSLGVWFNDKLYNNEYIYFVNFADMVGNTVGIVSDKDGSTVTIGAIAELKEVLPDPSLKKLTFDHFGIQSGEYVAKHPSMSTTGSYSKGLDNTYFAGYVTYTGAAQIIYGYKGSGMVFTLSGNNFQLNHNAHLFAAVNFDAETAGLKSFNDKFRLGISTQFVDNDSDGQKDDVKLGVFFNEALYNGTYLYFDDYVERMGDTLAIYGNGSGIKLTVGNIEEYKDPVVSRPLDDSFEKFTFNTIDIVEKLYTVSDGIVRGAYSKSFDGAAFGGKVTFSAKTGAQILYAATGGNAGLQISVTADGRLMLSSNTGKITPQYFLASKAGLEAFTDKAFDLGISTRYVDSDNDGEKDDVELGMWFNDVLYGDEFIYLTNYVQYMDQFIYIYCPPANPDTTIEIESRSEFMPVIIPVTLDPNYTKFTFETVSINDGLYTVSNGIISGSYSKSFDGAVFGGKVVFSKESGAQIIYAATHGNAGMTIKLLPDGRLELGSNTGKISAKSFLASKAGVSSFADTAFNLSISTKYVDSDNDGEKDDVELGMWFNDALYGNEFIYLTDYVQYMDKYIFLYCPPAFPDTTLTVETRQDYIPVVIPEKLDQSFKVLTLNNFAIADGLYQSKAGLSANGSYLKSIDKTYFAFNAKFDIADASVPVSFQYAGNGSGWGGFAIDIYADKIIAGDNRGYSDKYTFTAKKANVESFSGVQLKFGISTEYLDLDSDGKKDDVRIGIWINDYLANNEYVDIIDYRQYIGDAEKGIGAGLGVYLRPSDQGFVSKAKLTSVKVPANFAQFGFTANWANELKIFAASAGNSSNSTGGAATQSPQTGEGASVVQSMIFSCIGLGGIMNTGKKRR